MAILIAAERIKMSNSSGIISKTPTITIVRHGQGLHNVDRGISSPDPPLTSKGREEARSVTVTPAPDLILISPMTRTIETAIETFGTLITSLKPAIKVQIWPELREGYDHARCNQGVAKADLMAKFSYPAWDFELCNEQWDYEPHTFEGAMIRAELVRKKLKNLVETGKYVNIVLVTHRGFIAFLVQGERFATCESRSYRIAHDDKVEGYRYGVGIDTGERQDFGPTVLRPVIE